MAEVSRGLAVPALCGPCLAVPVLCGPCLAVPALCGPPSQCPLSAARAWQCPFSAARAWQCPLSAARPRSARSLRPALAVPVLCGPRLAVPALCGPPSQCPLSAARACSPRCPQLRLLPAEASAPGGCLAPRSPLFSPTPALPPDSSPSGRSPRGSAKPRAQAAGPGEADQAGFLRPPCPGARPPVGVRTVASGLGQVQAAPRSQLETDTHVASY